jgi:AraC-like DNA-binding protein
MMEFTWFGKTIGNNVSSRRINDYSFIYVVSGRGRFFVQGNTYDLYPNDMFVLFKEDLHSYYSDKENPWELLWFGIIGESVKSLIESTRIQKAMPVLKRNENPLMKDAFQKIVSILADQRSNRFFAIAEFMQILGYMSEYFSNNHLRMVQPEDRIMKTVKFIDLNYSYPIDTEIMAHQAGFARTYFCTLFKSIVGKSPIEYLTGIRLKHAEYLLKYSAMTIQQISNSVGFEDSLYFSKLFRRYRGMSPTAFRHPMNQH